MSRPRSGGLGVAFDPLAELAKAQRRRMTPERFWAKVDKDGPVVRAELGPCWVWTGRLSRDGYGLVSWCGRDIPAHRVACALAHGPLGAGTVARHRCDHPPCCRPDHLEKGSIDDNNRDMIARGRASFSAEHLVRVGETNVNAKLTDALVLELRAAWLAGEGIKSIARRTGLAVGTIHPMLHGKTWKHVGMPVRRTA